MKKALLPLCLIALCFVSFSQADQQLPPLITVTGTGLIMEEPDQVAVTLGVQLRDRNLNTLTNRIDTVSSNIIAYLKRKGIAAKDIQTSYYTVYPYYTSTGTDDGSTQIDFYTASQTITFILRKISNYDNVMNGLYDVGVNTVNDISFQISDDDYLKMEARRYAVANATETARLLAQELGVTLTGVYVINDQTYDQSTPVDFAEEASFAESAPAPSIAGGEVTVTATVGVSFYINN